MRAARTTETSSTCAIGKGTATFTAANRRTEIILARASSMVTVKQSKEQQNLRTVAGKMFKNEVAEE